MTDMVAAQTVVSAASSLLQDARLARAVRLDTLYAAIDEHRRISSKSGGTTWLMASLVGLSLLALGGMP